MTSLRKRIVEDEYKPCQHLLNYKTRHGVRGFQILKKCMKVRPPGRVSIRRDDKEVPRCNGCGRSRGRLYACLLCAAIGCWGPDLMHARNHALSKPGHDLAVDVDRAELFCCICCDQVYDPDFDRALICAQSAAIQRGRHVAKAEIINGFTGVALRAEREKSLIDLDVHSPDTSKNPEKRRKTQRAEYRPWVPSHKEQMLLDFRSTPLKEDTSLPSGLRGLNNLGSTCFMNCVLQALLHTAPLRNYFLSDRHNRTLCQHRASHVCLGCEMDAIFSAAFSGERTPYSPAQFLYSWWRHASNLAGYEQQDAHEFFISTLNGIHANSGTASAHVTPHSQTSSAVDTDCRCIIHQVFYGLLRSDVTCIVCGFTSTTFDPCVDISLDLEPNIANEKSFTDSILASTQGGRDMKGTSANTFPGAATLMGCLDRFTRPEKLSGKEKFFCKNCRLPQDSIKQMSIRKLPLVLCFHIKRFEHSMRNASRKIDRYVQFPFSLDMAPYLSSSIVKFRHGNRLLFIGNEDHEQLPSSEFEIYAVITHSGKLDSGHYITFLRLGGRWYRCDDSWITRVSDEVVRASQCYMLFYVQKTLSYKAAEFNAGIEDHCWTERHKKHFDAGYLSNGRLENGISAYLLNI